MKDDNDEKSIIDVPRGQADGRSSGSACGRCVRGWTVLPGLAGGQHTTG